MLAGLRQASLKPDCVALHRRNFKRTNCEHCFANDKLPVHLHPFDCLNLRHGIGGPTQKNRDILLGKLYSHSEISSY
jgi:hypothetical protein